MAGLLSGLAGLGLDNLENMNIFEETSKAEESAEAKVVTVEEKDFIYDKTMECPVCGQHFSTKIMKTGKNNFESYYSQKYSNARAQIKKTVKAFDKLS